MLRVFKYAFPIQDEFALPLPIDAQCLHVVDTWQSGPFVWHLFRLP